MKRKALSLLLVLAMVLAVFAGCGQKEAEKKEETSTTTPAQSETKTEEKKEEVKADEPPTKITLACTSILQTEPCQWYETDVWKEIWKLANVEIEYIQYDAELYKLMLTSGDTPDLVVSGIGDNIDDVMNSGLLVNMDEYAEYAPNMFSDTFAQRNELTRKMKGGKDNELLFVALGIGKENARGAADTSRGYSIRWDWYKEIGCPEMHSSDDYLDVIEQILKNHPTTENGEQVYGIGLYDNLTQWYMMQTFEEPILLNPWLIHNSSFMVGLADNVLVNGYTNTERSAYWAAVKFYNKAWNRGLIDPDSFTQTSDERTTKATAGRYVSEHPTRSNSLYNEAKKSDPNTTIGMQRIPTDNYLVFADKKMLTGDFPVYSIWLGKNSKNIEACMRLLNVLHDEDVQRMLWSGFEGIHWNYVDGVPALTDEAIKMIADGGEAIQKAGFNQDWLPGHIIQRSFEHSDGYPLCLADTDEMRNATMNSLQKDVSEYYGVQYVSQHGTKMVAAGEAVDMSNDCAQLIASFMPSRPTDVDRIIEKCNDVLYRALPKLVQAKDQAEFDAIQAQVLKDLAEAGVEDAWTWIKAEYDKAYAEIRPIFEACTW